MKGNQWTVYVLVLMLLFALLVGCGAESEPESGDATEPQQGEEQEGAEQEGEELGARLSGQFVDLMSGDEYLMKYRTTMDFEGQAMEVEATVAVSGENTTMISKTNDMESTMIIKGDKSYVIDHGSKMVLQLAEAPDAGDSSFDESTGIVDVDPDITYLGDGTEGNLTYEEYASIDGTIRYYFDGDEFVKMVVNSNGQTITMEILEISDSVPDGMFDIPGDYQLITM